MIQVIVFVGFMVVALVSGYAGQGQAEKGQHTPTPREIVQQVDAAGNK